MNWKEAGFIWGSVGGMFAVAWGLASLARWLDRFVGTPNGLWIVIGLLVFVGGLMAGRVARA